MNRSFLGATEAQAREVAASALGSSPEDLDVREVARRRVADEHGEREEVEIVVRTTESPATDDAARVDDSPRTAVRDERTSRGPRRAPTASPNEASPDALAPRAKEFLGGMLERMDVRARLEIEVDDENVYIEIVAEEGLGGLLIGRKGQTLDALQYLTNRIVLPGAQARGRIYLDTENYREKHRRKLEKRALELRDEVVRDHRAITLEELNPRDRWIIHQALMGDERVTTKSEGEADDRRLMIIPR